jgi:hypothetical protein
MNIQQDIAQFVKFKRQVDEDEQAIKDAKERLKNAYAFLVALCPHSEAVDVKSNLRGVGTKRICKICGITDYASEGGTPGDEYDYGYPGYPSRSFWKDTEVEVISQKESWQYSRSHEWVVKNGKAVKRKFGD